MCRNLRVFEYEMREFYCPLIIQVVLYIIRYIRVPLIRKSWGTCSLSNCLKVEGKSQSWVIVLSCTVRCTSVSLVHNTTVLTLTMDLWTAWIFTCATRCTVSCIEMRWAVGVVGTSVHLNEFGSKAVVINSYFDTSNMLKFRDECKQNWFGLYW